MFTHLERVGGSRWKVSFRGAPFDPFRPIMVRYDGANGRAWVNSSGWLDRVDGPALEWQDGDKEWWRQGWNKGREFNGKPLGGVRR